MIPDIRPIKTRDEILKDLEAMKNSSNPLFRRAAESMEKKMKELEEKSKNKQ